MRIKVYSRMIGASVPVRQIRFDSTTNGTATLAEEFVMPGS